MAYAIGVAQPVSVLVETFGTENVDPDKISDAVREVFDLRPAAIIRDLELRRPIYQKTAAYGHFGREDKDLTWEHTTRVGDLKSALGSLVRVQHVTPLVVRVLPDVPAIDKTFDYLVPDALRDQVRVGDVVRIELHGRRVGGWIVAVGVEPPDGVALRPLAKRSGPGSDRRPDRAGRVGGVALGRSPRLAPEDRVARAGRAAPARGRAAPDAWSRRTTPCSPARSRRRGRCCGCRPPPTSCTSPSPAPRSATRWCCARRRRWRPRSPIGCAAPGVAVAAHPARLGAGRGGCDRRRHPGGGVGAGRRPGVRRGARRARRGAPAGAVTDLARARRRHRAGPAGRRALRAHQPVPHAGGARLGRAPRRRPRPGPSRAGRWSRWSTSARRTRATVSSPERWPGRLRDGGRVLCVLNRTGRAKLLACRACGELARCAVCEAAVHQPDDELVCPRCGATRPPVCAACGVEPLPQRPGRRGPGAGGAGGARRRAGRRGHRHLHGRSRASGSWWAPRRCSSASTGPTWSRSSTSTRSSSRRATAPPSRRSPSWPARRGWWRRRRRRAPARPVACSCRPGCPSTRSCRPPCAPTSGPSPRRSGPAAQLLRFPPDDRDGRGVRRGGAGVRRARSARRSDVEVVEAGTGRWWLRAPDHQTLCDALAATRRPPAASGSRSTRCGCGRYLPGAGCQSSKRLPSGSSAQVKRP